MKFELEVDIDTINKETSRCLGVVFTEEYLQDFFTRKPEILGYVVNTDYGLDTYEREWLMELLSDENIGMTVPMNMDSDETQQLWEDKWIEFMQTSDRIDTEASKRFLDQADGTF